MHLSLTPKATDLPPLIPPLSTAALLPLLIIDKTFVKIVVTYEPILQFGYLSRKTDRYDRLCLDLEGAGFQVSNTPLEVGVRGYINPRNMAVLATLSSLCRVKDFKKFTRTLGKISLLGSYKVWLARRSNEWAPGSLTRA